ncbi:MAG: NAD(P)/FAD-dependent oxidoreductase [Thermoleophilia bacterium]|nr:NAD(P)/FAD-dependent oxidoreductase [Thermoleophilia bacterium]
MEGYDAVVVGSGPNGLAAAVTLARAGRSVLVREAADSVGGGTRSAELTLPGFVHDVCSAIHPLGASSPVFRSWPLREYGLEWIHADLPLVHPFEDGSAVALARDVDETAEGLGRDGDAYRRLVGVVAAEWRRLEETLLGPLVRVPRHPLALARFAFSAARSADALARSAFRCERARALLAGCAAHSMLPLETSPSASFGLVLLALGHVAGWPVARGGSGAIPAALAAHLRALGGVIETSSPVESLRELPRAGAVLCDVSPPGLLRVAGNALPRRYARALRRYRFGPGAFKLDLALDGPVPWRAAEAGRTACLHVGGTLAEIAEAERAPWQGRIAERPHVLVAQQTAADPARAPAGRHTVWAYCHVPNGSTEDATERIERQIERFAPGFRARVLARSVRSPADLEAYDRNPVGGDINGGVQDWRGLLARPAFRLVPYATPLPGLFLCSASTPPGGGVHGMCGFLAAQAALRGPLARRTLF